MEGGILTISVKYFLMYFTFTCLNERNSLFNLFLLFVLAGFRIVLFQLPPFNYIINCALKMYALF